MVGMAAMGRVLADRAQARTAADAAALAGAVDGRSAARDVARANGARVVAYDTIDGAVVVKVARGRVTAFARARAVHHRRAAVSGPYVPGHGTGMRAGLVQPLVDALGKADRLLGTPVPIASGYRSVAQQQILWNNRAHNPYPVARPGTSHHQQGRAVDVPRWFVPRLLTVAADAGLCQPMPRTDPVHFELCT
jgi:hypothetical protein